MQIGVLGRLQARRAGVELDLGSRKQRILLAGLALTPNQAVSTDRLVDLLWGDAPPPAVAASLHGYVAGLRRALEPDRLARDRPQVLLTSGAGYELRVAGQDLDVTRFAAAVESLHHEFSGADAFAVPDALSTADLGERLATVEEALSWWRGSPFAELPDDPSAVAERTRLEDLRLLALQDRARLQLALGRPAAAAAELAPLVQQHPLREDLWGLHALALVRGGRQAEALETLRAARAVLADELGIDPGPGLRHLQQAILRQDHALLRPPATAAEPGRAPAQPAPAPARPPLVGRGEELTALTERAETALTGLPQWALLVGEPGIGKTRLTQELADRARSRGFTVLTGRCSQDEGAPPLWPWVAVLRSLAEAWPELQPPDLQAGAEWADDGPASSGQGTQPGDRFRSFDAVARLLVRVSAAHPLLLVFDDLHWADASTLRLLRHLVETVDTGALLVVLTRRARPEPQGAAAQLAESLARHDMLRLELPGLDTAAVTDLAKVTTGHPPDLAEAAELRDRTGGNPFFLVEVLRLGRPLQDQPPGTVPPAVGDVITARVGQLPPDTQEVLRLASVLGRSVDVEVLSRLQSNDVLDALEPALAAGTLVHTPDGGLQFSHALVRDAVYASVGPLRRQRRHAEIAELLSSHDRSGPGLAEVARHWLHAGPAHAARAWPAAMAAAAYATRLQAHEEAADLLAAALASQAQDPSATRDERYDLLMARARACRAAANSEGQRSATAEAIRLAEDAGDVERLAQAAVTSSEGALWSNRTPGEVDAPTVEALQRAARDLPGEDTPLRCQVFLALSRELYWSPHPQEREAYGERGLAMARRLGDPQLRAWACHTTFVAALRPATMASRIVLAQEATASSRDAGDEEGETIGLLFQALVSGEAGRLAERADAVGKALRLAGRNRLRYLQVMLGSYEVPWLALQGRFAEAEELYADTLRWAVHASFPFRDEALAAARLCLDLWRGRAADLLPALTALQDSGPVDVSSALLLLRLRAGTPAEVAAHLERHPLRLGDDTFESPMLLALAAEAALVLRRPELAAAVYPLLAPWTGRFVSAGTGTPVGPVECFLALAAAAVGEVELATSHADEAAAICREIGLVPVTAWFDRHRAGAGF